MRVLVVEDDRRLAELLERGFMAESFVVEVERRAWWPVAGQRAALRGDRSRRHAARTGRMCAQLRKAEVRTPVLMLTAKDGEWGEVEGLDTGADDYLTKPFSYPVLVARLRALVRRGAVPRPTVLRAGDLELDPATRTCRRGRLPVVLTAKEFAVLEFLLRRSDRVVSKAEITAGVWDEAREPDANLVEVYISSLRRKIDAPFDRRTITTVRGAAYRLDSRERARS